MSFCGAGFLYLPFYCSCYDHLGRLEYIRKPGGTLRFFYEDETYRLQREEWSGSTSQSYILAEYKWANGRPHSFTVREGSIYNTYYYEYNWRGDVAFLTRPDGSQIPYPFLTGRTDFSMNLFGQTSNSAPHNRYRWNGGWGYLWIDEAGLYLIGQRWYHPDIGRWMSPDASRSYVYLNNDPVNQALSPEGDLISAQQPPDSEGGWDPCQGLADADEPRPLLINFLCYPPQAEVEVDSFLQLFKERQPFDACELQVILSPGGFVNFLTECLPMFLAAQGEEDEDQEGSGRTTTTEGTGPPLSDPRLRDQTQRVIQSMDSTGKPPVGVRQGGQPPGHFENREGKLPRQMDKLYYTESDVWPGPGPRGLERLVFGKGGEVFYSPDHFETFIRIR